jgi:DinB family protein/pentapeptide repeat protein
MTEFLDVDLRGARFEQVEMNGAHFRRVDLSDAQFRSVDLSRVVMRGVDLIDVDIHGEVENLVINGVDVAPLIEAELDRRHPDRVKMRPVDPQGFREAWSILDRLWEGTIERARDLTPDQLHESVNGEWSFIETLRHLSYATDSWIRRAILGDPSPWDVLDWPPDEFPDAPEFARLLDARPTLDEVLELRRGRTATVRDYLEHLTEEILDDVTTPVEAPGWPPSQSFPVRTCLRVVLNEEWQHRLYVERDFDIVAQQ